MVTGKWAATIYSRPVSFEDGQNIVRAYVVNLARSPERRAHMVFELSECAVEHEFIEAFDGRDLDLADPEITELIAASFLGSDSFRSGVAGCALSHIAVYRQILADGLERALVLEDDITLPRDLGDVADAVGEHLVGAEVALLNFDSPEPCRLTRKGSISLASSRDLVRPVDVSQPESAAAYVITRQACERIVKSAPPVKTKADDWGYMCRQGLLDGVWCVVPLSVTKDPGFASTINYLRQSGLKARLLAVISRRDLLFARQIVAYRRKRIWRQYRKVEFVD